MWWPQRLCRLGHWVSQGGMADDQRFPSTYCTPPSNLILHGSGQIGELCRLNFLPTKWNRGSELNSVRKSWMLYSLHAWIYKLKFISKIILKTRICLKDLGIYSIHIQCLYSDPFTLSYFKYANIHLHVYLPNQILSFLKAGTMLSSFLCSE